jgi:hypothetical protein
MLPLTLLIRVARGERISAVKLTIDDLKARTDRVQVDDIDFDDFKLVPLDADSLRCLRYMHDVEHNTIIYLRDVLVTDAHLDHEITSFLTFWAFEEYFHGEAISRVLEAHGEPGSDQRVPEVRRPSLHDRILPVSTMLASHVSRHVPAVHMTWGAINEWSAQAAYGRLAARAGHPTLTKLLHRIMKQEGRHIDFYASQAITRLEASVRAQRITRWALRQFWTPVGAGIKDKAEVRFMVGHLFGGDDGLKAAQRIDRCIDRLPGLAGMHLAERSSAR